MQPLTVQRVSRVSAALALLGLAACNGAVDAAGSDDQGSGGQGGGAGGCPNDLPESCPSPEPSFAAEVAEIFAERCFSCHSEGGQAAGKSLGDHDGIHALRSAVLNQVYACKMPPPAAAQLTPDERAALLAWLVCGAKDN